MGGGGSSGGSQQVTNQTILPDWVTAQAQSNLATANNVASTPYTPYPGTTVAGLTPEQQAAYNWTGQNLGTASNTINAAEQAIAGPNLAVSAQNLLNPYLGQVEQTGVAQINQTAAQEQNQIAGQAAQAGAFGGTRFGVQSGILGAQTAMQTGQFVAQTQAQGWDDAVKTAMAQAGQVGQLAQQGQATGIASAAAAQEAGNAQQNQNQAVLTNAYQQWLQQQQYPLQQLGIQESALTSTPYGGTSTSTQPLNSGGTGSAVMAGLGGAATGAALGAAGSAALGATAGSVVPGIGTAIGGVLGALAGILSSR